MKQNVREMSTMVHAALTVATFLLFYFIYLFIFCQDWKDFSVCWLLIIFKESKQRLQQHWTQCNKNSVTNPEKVSLLIHFSWKSYCTKKKAIISLQVKRVSWVKVKRCTLRANFLLHLFQYLLTYSVYLKEFQFVSLSRS